MSLQEFAMIVVDSIMAALPRPVPDTAALARCKIISHRGEHDNQHVRENTLQAFEQARDAGVWGIECDVRWTADLTPVICHDPSPARVFGASTPVSKLSFAQLRASVPEIPTLQEVIEQFGNSTHLMLELKAEPWPQPYRQREILRSLLAPLDPVTHYHILALDPALFAPLDFLPSESFFPVAEINVKQLSRTAIQNGYGGLGGHYLLLTNRLHRNHAVCGQRLGTGFPASKNALFRELNRGVELIFSNNAVALQAIRDYYLYR